MKQQPITTLMYGASALAISPTLAPAETPTYPNTTGIPANVFTPDRTETRVGTLEFVDGVPPKSRHMLCGINWN